MSFPSVQSAARNRDRSALIGGYFALIDLFIPPECLADPDETRKARMISHFGVQGTLFGMVYATFYNLIGHFSGARVIVICSLIFAAIPLILRWTHATRLSGHLLVGTMAAGFTQLTLIEGGIHSHAVAWLASVPLCALLIVGIRPAMVWAGVCFVVGTAIGLATLSGYELEPLYDPKWHSLIDAAGNLGIIIFLFALGLVFEINRSTAFQRMEQSLEELSASNEELAHLNNEKTEFLGIAAHDLRNPLTVVIGMADLLRYDISKNVAESGEMISTAGQRMLNLINDLLDANAIEEGRYASHLESNPLRELIATSVQHQHLSSERKNIAIDVVPGPESQVMVDRKATLQVLDNLLSNALKYSPMGSRILVTVHDSDGFTEVAVRDQGPGISAEDQQKLFQKHTKLSARPTGGESSIGLGLSIVKRLAEAMGGGVSCKSALGQGSTFIFKVKSAAPVIESRSNVEAVF